MKTGLSPDEAGRLNFQHGQGSLWQGAWLRSAARSEDAGDSGGRGDGGGSVAQTHPEGEQRSSSDGAASGPRCGGAPDDRIGNSAIAAADPDCQCRSNDRTDGDPGAEEATRIAARNPALRRSGVAAFRAALRGAWAGGFGRLLRDL